MGMDPLAAFICEMGMRAKIAEATVEQQKRTLEEQKTRIAELERQVAGGSVLRTVQPEEAG